MEHRTDREAIVLSGLPADEREHVVRVMVKSKPHARPAAQATPETFRMRQRGIAAHSKSPIPKTTTQIFTSRAQ